jgi:oxygen-dependent protoporphyrinogen oxidase
MALDLFIPRRKSTEGDETLASFVTRRLGKEALQRVAQPLVSGIYTADPNHMSLRATMPRFLEMEANHRSVIKAMWKQRKAMSRQKRGESGVRYSMFVSLEAGMHWLVDELASRLPTGSVHVDNPVASAGWDGTDKSWHVNCDDGSTITAQGLILALPGYQGSKVTRDLDPALADELDGIEYASSATVNLAYREADVAHPLDGFGFVVPAIEVRSIVACTFCHRKFPGRAPNEHVLMRVFMGGALHPHHLNRDDGEMVLAAREDLARFIGLDAEPLFTSVRRYPRSMPQYPVGHLDRVRRIEEKASRHPHLRIAGNAMGGVGIPDCATSGKEAADALFDELTG